jgi:hypothetical protein
MVETTLGEGSCGSDLFRMSEIGQCRPKLNKLNASCVGMHDGKVPKFVEKRGWLALVTGMH